jgi:gas vesicle protein
MQESLGVRHSLKNFPRTVKPPKATPLVSVSKWAGAGAGVGAGAGIVVGSTVRYTEETRVEPARGTIAGAAIGAVTGVALAKEKNKQIARENKQKALAHAYSEPVRDAAKLISSQHKEGKTVDVCAFKTVLDAQTHLKRTREAAKSESSCVIC